MKYQTILFLLSFVQICAQPHFPEQGFVFDDEQVARVDIAIASTDSLAIMNDIWSNEEYPADFTFTKGTVVESVDNVGFRLRGNTSRSADKKSFKISFNTYESGRKFHGLEKMNLNGEHNDPSIVRAKLGWDILRAQNIPATRANHIAFYINGEYRGLYINVEHIDEEFVENRFGNNDGNLYKCLWPATLHYLGDNPEQYKFTVGGRRAYALKTNTDTDDYSDLSTFIDILNNAPLADFPCELENVFNVRDYLKCLAFDVAMGNWDGPIYNKNNFYLYKNTETGQFEYIPYDLDNTIGIDWIGRNWATRNIYDWMNHGEYRPLYERLMLVDEYKDLYTYYLNQLFTEIIVEAPYYAQIDVIREMLVPFVTDDVYYTLDYNFDEDDFYDSYDLSLNNHSFVPFGIKEFFTERGNATFEQMELNNIKPIIKYVQHNHPLSNDEISISAYVEDESPDFTVNLAYYEDNTFIENLPMFDDGYHLDGAANDGFYGAIITPTESEVDFSFEISATDDLGLTAEADCEDIHIDIEVPAAFLFINEFMAENDDYLADEFGEFDDWIELYNGSTESIFLGDKYLTDDLMETDKFQLPNVTLAANDFILIWADKQSEQGDHHANFSLNESGEEIGLFDQAGNIIDRVVYRKQRKDHTEGYYPDGSGSFSNLSVPTANETNQGWTTGTYEVSNVESNFTIYPNPATAFIQVDIKLAAQKRVLLKLMDLNGRMIQQETMNCLGDCSTNIELPNTIVRQQYYFMTVEVDGQIIAAKKVLII